MPERQYVVTFEGDKARIELKPPVRYPSGAARLPVTTQVPGGPKRYHIFAPSPARAEQIARVMKGQE